MTTIFSFQGNGIVNEYTGGYDDWERQQPSIAPDKPPEQITKIKKRSGSTDVPATKKKLSFREKEDLLRFR